MSERLIVAEFAAEHERYILQNHLVPPVDIAISLRHTSRVEIVPILPNLEPNIKSPIDKGTTDDEGNFSSTGSGSLKRNNSMFSTEFFNDKASSENSNSADSGVGFGGFFGSGQRRRPKNDVTKTKSSFITGGRSGSALSATSHTKSYTDVSTIFTGSETSSTEGLSYGLALFNIGKTFLWTNLQENSVPNRLIFSKSLPTCHDVNRTTLQSKGDGLDVVIGFSTGDIIWLDPIRNKYLRLNKQVE